MRENSLTLASVDQVAGAEFFEPATPPVPGHPLSATWVSYSRAPRSVAAPTSLGCGGKLSRFRRPDDASAEKIGLNRSRDVMRSLAIAVAAAVLGPTIGVAVFVAITSD